MIQGINFNIIDSFVQIHGSLQSGCTNVMHLKISNQVSEVYKKFVYKKSVISGKDWNKDSH